MRRLFAFALVFGSVASCSSTDIVVANFAGTPCSVDTPCPSGEFCQRHDCEDLRGICLSPPLICDEPRKPFCGCDGITYWNDCVRRQHRVTAATEGECGGLTPSADPQPCGGPGRVACKDPSAICSSLLSCDPKAPGTCWVLPEACPAFETSALFVTCGGAASGCDDACRALKTGEPHRPFSGPTCP